MKTVLLLGCLLFTSLIGISQNQKIEAPDYGLIEKEIADKVSDLYYPKLMIRYKLADSTMTLEEKRHLYYGYSFQEGYSPYGRSEFDDSLRSLLKKKKHTDDDYREIIRFADSILFENPFDLGVIDNTLYAYEALGDVEKFNENIIRMRIVLDALLSSGDGLKKKSAFYVIYTSHEYFLVKILGFAFGGEQRLVEHYDFLKLAKNANKIEGFYFDVSPCLNKLSAGFK